MTLLLRVLGLQALHALLQTLSPRAARAASLMLLAGANALPLIALLTGQWRAGDVLIAFWLENVAIGLWAAVRMATALALVPTADGGLPPSRGRGVGLSPLALAVATVGQSADPRAARVLAQVAKFALVVFFAVHFGGFTLVHGLFTFSLAREAGTTGTFGGFALMLLALLASHGLSTAIYWFARGERRHVPTAAVMTGVYPRVVVMHLAVLGAGWLLLGDDGPALPAAWAAVAPGLLLIGIKVVADVAAHQREHRGALRRRAPEPQPVG